MRTKLNIKVIPGASSSGTSGWLDETLKVKVSAPPEKGKANQAAVILLASALGLSSNAVRVLRGAGAQRKVLEIDGLSLAEIQRRLSNVDTGLTKP